MKKHALKLVSLLSIALLAVLFAPPRAAADDDDDPPGRVARLAFTRGAVSFEPAGTEDWVTAVVNRPVTTGDKLWTDNGARAELHIGNASIRLGDNTGFSFLNLTDNITQLRLTEGTVRVRVKRLDDEETFEIDTPNLAFSVLRPGVYSVNVNEAGDTTIVKVMGGDGEVTGGGSAYAIHANQVGTFQGTDQISADVESYGGDDDDFDNWCADRDRREDHSSSVRYVSDDVVGYEDLDDNGGWRPVPEYGTVWFPHVTTVGWAPYRYGHWAWIAPWGWTWVDDASWGYAPFHYGRWVTVGGVWGWVPCPPRPAVYTVAYVRPVYSPALVAWVGGGGGVGIGIGVGVAWFPLGPREVYCPSYHVSERYVERVNVSNTVIVNKTIINNTYNNVYINKTTNITNVTYVNRTAVTATSQAAFTGAQPVGRNMVKVDARAVANAPVAPLTPAVAPQQRSVLGAGTQARALPPAAVQNRAIVAKTAPPPAPVSFNRQQQAIQQNGGRPLAISQTRQLEPQNTNARANVKIAPPAKAVTPPQNTVVNRNNNQPNNNNRPVTPNVQQNNNPNRPNTNTNQGNVQQNNQNRPNTNVNTNPNTNVPQNNKSYNDRPPVNRPSNNANPALEQKQQQQLEQLRNKQDQQRQKVEQQQIQQQQKLEQQKANDAKVQQQQQKQQQQLEQMERKHDQQQQQLQQKQAQERTRQDNRPPKPPENKPPKEDKPHR